MRRIRAARIPGRLGVLALLMISSVGTAADEAPKTETKPESKNGVVTSKPSTVKVEIGTIKVETSLKGVIEARHVAEVSLKPESWNMPLVVASSVEHGTAVKQGDVLVEIDTEAIAQAIKDLQLERSLAELGLKHADEELPVLEKFLPLDLAAAERTKKRADEDLARFLETDLPLAKLGADFELKSAKHWLESAKDELQQLEKMYRSKDLTEETEQFILKRHRFQVESAELSLKFSESTADRTLKIDLPRRELAARDDTAKQSLALQRTRSLMPLEISQKRLARDKLRFEKEKIDERLTKLEHDRKEMTVRAPADGIVYYGKAFHGQWPASSALAQKLQPGGVIVPQEVFISIVSLRPAFVRATVDEKELHTLRPKLEGKAVPTGFPDLKLPAQLVSISTVPQSPGNFEARVDIDLGSGTEMLVPGMACAVKFVPYRKNDALTVPSSAVFTDDDDARYVYVPQKEGKPKKKTVTTGKTSDSKIEILDGLKEGDEILSSKP